MATPEFADETLQIQLSHEEIWTLLKEIGALNMVGLVTSRFSDLDAEKAQAILDTARHSLCARNIMRDNGDGRTTIAQDIVSLLHVCLLPQAVLTAFHWDTRQSPATALYVYKLDDQIIVRLESQPHVHEFTRLDSLATVSEAVLRFCQSGDQNGASADPVFSHMTIPLALFNALRQPDRPATEQLISTLSDGSVDAVALEQAMAVFLPDAETPTSLIRILQPGLDEGLIEQQELSFSRQDDTIWALSAAESANDTSCVCIRSMTPAALRSWLEQHFGKE